MSPTASPYVVAERKTLVPAKNKILTIQARTNNFNDQYPDSPYPIISHMHISYLTSFQVKANILGDGGRNMVSINCIIYQSIKKFVNSQETDHYETQNTNASKC